MADMVTKADTPNLTATATVERALDSTNSSKDLKQTQKETTIITT